MDQDDAPKVAEPAVTVERDGHVLLMGLNRPAKRNAFGVQLLAELGAAYRLLGSDDDLSCGVLFAHGDHFTAGLDLTEAVTEHFDTEILALVGTADAAEGVMSFVERRDATFTGR